MLSRRIFIKSALATHAGIMASSSHAIQLAINSAQDIPLLVFADDKALNSRIFIANVTGEYSSIELDIGHHFDLLREFCKESPGGQIAGLTRDSDFFVLEQVAKDFGFYVQYSATHSYTGDTLTHDVSTSNEYAELIASSLENAKESWPQWLARNMQVLPRSNAESITVQSQSIISNAAQHEFLVSWSLGSS
jgi:hypothetical protein